MEQLKSFSQYIWKIRSKLTPLHQSKMTPFARAN